MAKAAAVIEEALAAPSLPAPPEGFTRVQLLAGMSGARFNFVPGQVLDVRQHIRERWIDHQVAVDYVPALVDVQIYDDEADVRPEEVAPPSEVVDETEPPLEPA